MAFSPQIMKSAKVPAFNLSQNKAGDLSVLDSIKRDLLGQYSYNIDLQLNTGLEILVNDSQTDSKLNCNLNLLYTPSYS